MELTPYTKKLFDLSGVRPEDAWSDIYTWDGRGAMEDQPSHIKSNGSIGWRSTLCLRISPYGFAFAGKSGIFYMKDLPYTEFAWDQLNSIKYKNAQGFNTNFGESEIETEYFFLDGPFNFIGGLYINLVSYSYQASIIVGKNLPIIRDPVNQGIIIACKAEKYFVNGYPTPYENALSEFVKMLKNGPDSYSSMNTNGNVDSINQETTKGGVEKELLEINDLKEKKLISDEEYEKMRKKILGI